MSVRFILSLRSVAAGEEWSIRDYQKHLLFFFLFRMWIIEGIMLATLELFKSINLQIMIAVVMCTCLLPGRLPLICFLGNRGFAHKGVQLSALQWDEITAVLRTAYWGVLQVCSHPCAKEWKGHYVVPKQFSDLFFDLFWQVFWLVIWGYIVYLLFAEPHL